jgi:pilus assembly protein CpaC
MRTTVLVGRGTARAIAWILIIYLVGTTSVLAQIRQAPAASMAPAAIEPEATPISLLVGRSTVIDLGTPITRVSLTSADIADALVTSSTQLLVNGKVPGTISMFVWERTGGIRRFEIAVHRDLALLDEQFQRLFPGEAIQAHSNGRKIVLSGTASTNEVMARAVSVASGFVEKPDEIVSLLQVLPGNKSNQVLLRVRFAEVSRSALTELGLSIFTGPTGIKNTLGRITTQQFSAPGFDSMQWSKDSFDFGEPVRAAEGKFTFSDFLNFFVLSERYDLGLLVRLLQSKGLFESLAEPNLVAESGKEASFLAGGEFPIPVAQGSGANIGISVQFKEFGVRLNFLPTINGDRVHLKVRPEVSLLDFNNAVLLGGFRIPALTTRRTETELELVDGQTFAIAGLMNNSMTQTLQKVPGIGDIPILGYLFRSKAAQKNQTELVVMITPQILPNNSSGVTTALPRLQEPFLPALQERESLPPPPPAFTAPSGAPGALNTTPDVPAAQTVAAASVVPQPTGAERKVLEQQARDERKALEQQAKAEQEAREQQAREARRAAEQQAREERAAREQQARDEKKALELRQKEERAERERLEKEERAAREQAKRDAEAAKKAAALQAELEKLQTQRGQ